MAGAVFGVGIVGWGGAARTFHAPFIPLVAGLELRAVATSRRAVVEAELPGVVIHDSLARLLGDDRVELVVIATPHRFHVEHASAALAAGKDVVVEKPLAATAAEAESVFARAREAGRRCIVYQNRRWDGDFQTVRRLIAGGTLGEVYHFENHWPVYRPALRGVWREEPTEMGGVLYDIAPHLIDQMLQLFGAPGSVYAQVAARRPGARTIDQFRLTLRYDGGLTAVLTTDMLGALPSPRFVVRGTRGAFEKQGLDPQEALLRAGQSPVGENWGADAPAAWGRLKAMGADGLTFDGQVTTVPGDYRGFYEAVRDALRDGGPSPIAPEEIVLQLRIVEAALRSAETNAVVTLT
jgi:scyllo-inositol 2-dehydrogenase (NADP+)